MTPGHEASLPPPGGRVFSPAAGLATAVLETGAAPPRRWWQEACLAPHGSAAYMRRIWRYLIMSSLPMYKITPTVTATAAPINFNHFIWSPRLGRPC